MNAASSEPSGARIVSIVRATDADVATADDAALLGRVAAGDRDDPLGALYDRYGPVLYRLGLRLLGEDGLAQELVQDTFVRLWRSAPRFDGSKGSVRTYIFTIARRVAIDFRRRPASRPLASADEGRLAEVSGEQAASEDIFDQLVLELDVREALMALAPKHREILELYYDQDLPQARIAERLGVPLGTVKTRTYYALRALRLEFEERNLLV